MKHPDALARAAQALRANGASYSQIAEALGLANAKSAVQGLLKRNLEPELVEPPPFIDPARLPPINHGCQWIDGDVRDGEWSWCGARVGTGEAWCDDHRRRVYVQRSKLRDEG